ncbi:hypothetical protein FBUS_09477 [Fasciolopsis buskii]|uniref:PIH1 N-terminal domain-containing protein n=1 Tax=Fasciolopsis buskii TaxID=27845 RepID=A0A8E0RPY8_9TREM|nr:hypothetical protein FBUS_09477 [Fasciolopsis buski]
MLIRIFHVQFLSAGKGCTAYDVIINPTFLKKVQTSELFEAFLMTVLFEGLEQKYDVDLERNWIVLKNKKSMGLLREQYVRSSSRPAIVELNDYPILKGDIPEYELIAVPEDGSPQFLVARIQLPKLVSNLC